MDKEMKINQVASLLNVSTDGIRFYEKKGVISPERNTNNNYRTYSVEDLARLYDVKVLQNIGFSLAEIADIVMNRTPEEFEEMLARKKEQIEAEHLRLSRRLAQTQRLISASETYEKYRDKYYINDSPHILACYFAGYDGLNNESLSSPFFKFVSEQHNLFRRCTVYPKGSIKGPSQMLGEQRGYSIEIENARALGIEPGGNVFEMKPQKSVYTVIRVVSRPEYDDLKPAFDWINEHGFRLNGDILAWTLKINFLHGTAIRYYSVWLPIK